MAVNPESWLNRHISSGRYHILAKLGEGGMGFVYRARDTNLDCDVVIKVPRLSMLVERHFAERFAREMHSLVQLAHPHIVRITDVGKEGKIPFTVMQYLAGGDLAARMDENRGELESWLPAIAAALDYVHERGYVHRDVKPDNVLFDERGHAYLSDFGVAKVVADVKEQQSAHLTGTGMVLGTADYMAPELILGEAVDGRIDQYALAITIYEVLAGRRPFAGNTSTAIMVAHTTESPAPIEGLGRSLLAALFQGLAKAPAERFASCSDLATAVLAAVAEQEAADPASLPASAKLDCPQCGKVLRASRQAAGKDVRCSGCNVRLRVSADLRGLTLREGADWSAGPPPVTAAHYLDPASGRTDAERPLNPPPFPESSSQPPPPAPDDPGAFRRMRTRLDRLPRPLRSGLLLATAAFVLILVIGSIYVSRDGSPGLERSPGGPEPPTAEEQIRDLEAQLQRERTLRALAERALREGAGPSAPTPDEEADRKAEAERKAKEEADRKAKEKATARHKAVTFTPHTISTAANGAQSVFATDLDGDGDTDVLSASQYDNKIAWYENDGEANFTLHTISTDANWATCVFAADLDGDGDTDVLSASYGDEKIAWYENDGRQRFTPHTISTEAKHARSVFATDVDGDGDTDVLSASQYDNKIAWYENDGEANFTLHTISTDANWATCVFAADLDGDGDTDVLSASESANEIAWYENDGEANFTLHTISTDAKGARSVFAADVDGDGDTDVLSASYGDEKIAWYENDGRQRFTPHTISTEAKHARSVFATDVDGDGDTDVLSASQYDNKIAWYENDGEANFTLHTISTDAKGARSVFATDVDGDGDTDVLSASFSDNKIAWHENRLIDAEATPAAAAATAARNKAEAARRQSRLRAPLPELIYESNTILQLDGTDATQNAIMGRIAQPQTITAEAVVRVKQGRKYGAIVGQAVDNHETEQGWQLGYSQNNFQLRIGAVGGRFVPQLASKTTLQGQKVHHVVGTYDGRMMKLYVDGVVESIKPMRGPINYPNADSSPFTIGAHKDSNEYFELNGTIYQVQVWAGPLNDAQVAARYNKVKDNIDGANTLTTGAAARNKAEAERKAKEAALKAKKEAEEQRRKQQAQSEQQADADRQAQELAERKAKKEAAKKPPAAVRSAANREIALRNGGGNGGSESAVAAALKWLADHQNRDGSWSWNHTPGDKCSGFANPGQKKTKVGATGLALLPFLGAGYTHQEGKGNKYKYVVQAGLQYLIGNMDPKSGRLYDRNGPDHEHMYSHGIAACAVAEAYGMTQDAKLKTPAQLALNYIVDAQDPESGGWLYTPRQGGDTSVVGWQIMALKSGSLSYLNVPGYVKTRANKWLDYVQSDFYSEGTGIGSRYGYREAKDRHGHQYPGSVTAIGLLCRNYLGTKKGDPGLRMGVEWLASQGPSRGDMYFNYYSSMVMYQNDGPKGPLWDGWNRVMRDQLINTQVQNGKDRGSWHFSGNHGNDGGRLYNTALSAMTLEVYYRYMPVYQNVKEEAERNAKESFREKKVTAAYQARHENPAAYLRSLGLDLQDNQWHMKSMGLLKKAVRDLKIATAKYNNYLPQYKLATREVKKNESTLRKFMAEYRLQAKDIQDYLINNWPTIQDDGIDKRFSTWKTWARTGRNKKGEKLTTFLDSKMDDFVKRKKALAGHLASHQQLQQQIVIPYERVSSLHARVQAATQEIDTQQPEVDAAIKSTGATYRLPNTQSAIREMRIAEACMEMDITSPPGQTENASSKTGEPSPREKPASRF